MWFAWAAYWPETAIWNGEGLLASPTAVDGDGILQRDFVLGQNFPNPFNATTLICYQLLATTAVSLVVYNSAGQLVRDLDAGYEQAGVYIQRWDGRTESGADASSGTYFYRLKIGANEQQLTRSMALVR